MVTFIEWKIYICGYDLRINSIHFAICSLSSEVLKYSLVTPIIPMTHQRTSINHICRAVNLMDQQHCGCDSCVTPSPVKGRSIGHIRDFKISKHGR